MANAFAPVKPAVVKKENNKSKVVLLRRKELGNNCHFIADAFPGGMQICQPNEVPNDATTIIRWGTTANLPDRPAGQPKRLVINQASAIHGTTEKGAFRLAANKAGLTARTWASLAALAKEDEVGKVVVRPLNHSRSEHLYLCATLMELEEAIKKCGGEGRYYISDYVEKTQEFRVFIASGRAFMVFEKTPKNKKDVSWGCVDEGALKYVAWSDWPMFVVENAIKAFNLSKLDFGAADIMVKDGKAYFLEINTAPEVWPYYGERFSDVFSYMIKNGVARIPVKDYTSWKHSIHPSITDKAVV